MGYEAEALDRSGTAGAFLKTMGALGRVKEAAPANDADGVAARVGPRPTVLSADVELKGSIVSRGELHIYGAIEGNVRAVSLTVCAGGSVKGDVVAETVVLAGIVEGRIFGRDVQLDAGALVTGDITNATLGVHTAAVFQGAVKRVEDPIQEASAR